MNTTRSVAANSRQEFQDCRRPDERSFHLIPPIGTRPYQIRLWIVNTSPEIVRLINTGHGHFMKRVIRPHLLQQFLHFTSAQLRNDSNDGMIHESPSGRTTHFSREHDISRYPPGRIFLLLERMIPPSGPLAGGGLQYPMYRLANIDYTIQPHFSHFLHTSCPRANPRL